MTSGRRLPRGHFMNVIDIKLSLCSGLFHFFPPLRQRGGSKRGGRVGIDMSRVAVPSRRRIPLRRSGEFVRVENPARGGIDRLEPAVVVVLGAAADIVVIHLWFLIRKDTDSGARFYPLIWVLPCLCHKDDLLPSLA